MGGGKRKLGPFRLKLSKSGLDFSFKLARDKFVFTGQGKWPKKEKQTVLTREIESVEIADLMSSSDKLAVEIKKKLRERQVFKIVVWAWFVLWGWACFKGEGVIAVLLLGLALGIYVWSKRAVVLFFDEPLKNDLKQFLKKLKGCRDFWSVQAWGEPLEKKYNLPVEELIKKKRCVVKKGAPGFIRTNVEIYQIYCGQQCWSFLPDKLVFSEKNKVAVFGYEQLKVVGEKKEFVVAQVPPEGQLVRKTWRYVNQDGSRDRRFGDNPELSVMLYGLLKVSGVGGFIGQFICSDATIVDLLTNKE